MHTHLPAIRYVLLLAIALVCGACQKEEEESHLENFSKQVQRALDSTTEKVAELSPSRDDIKSLTTDELNKLYAFEYHVIEIPREETSTQLQIELSTLGKDRWECFHVEPLEKSYRIFCKRRPQTYLRYIPRIFP